MPEPLPAISLVAVPGRRRHTLDIAREIDGAPQPVLHTGDFEHHLVQMPLVADAREPATDSVGERLAKFARPLPHRFVANSDAASSQQLLDHSQPEREPEIQPDGVADDLDGEPIAGIAGASRCHHPTRLPIPMRYRKRPGLLT